MGVWALCWHMRAVTNFAVCCAFILTHHATHHPTTHPHIMRHAPRTLQPHLHSDHTLSHTFSPSPGDPQAGGDVAHTGVNDGDGGGQAHQGGGGKGVGHPGPTVEHAQGKSTPSARQSAEHGMTAITAITGYSTDAQVSTTPRDRPPPRRSGGNDGGKGDSGNPGGGGGAGTRSGQKQVKVSLASWLYSQLRVRGHKAGAAPESRQ